MHIVTIKVFTQCRSYGLKSISDTITSKGFRPYPNEAKGEVHFYVSDGIEAATRLSEIRKLHKLLYWDGWVTRVAQVSLS